MEVLGETTGSWLLTTASGSMYVIDLDARTSTRVPDPAQVEEWIAAGHARPDDDELVPFSLAPDFVAEWEAEMVARHGDEWRPSVGLRRDGEALPLLSIGHVAIGERVPMVVRVLSETASEDELVVTTRTTTPLVEVRRLP